jgi:hypothetical protein
MPRPPDCVVFVARTHWTIAGAIAVAAIPMHWLGTQLPGFELRASAYLVVGGLMSGYALAGALVWRGAVLGRTLSRICSLLYLPRPQLGSRVWEAMKHADFEAHFSRR